MGKTETQAILKMKDQSGVIRFIIKEMDWDFKDWNLRWVEPKFYKNIWN